MATTSYGTPYVEAADLVSGYPSTSLTLADRVDDISFKGNGINNQTGTTYTLDILDAGKTVTLSNGSAVTVTIPTNTAEAIEIGSIIRFNNKGAGLVTIQPDGGVTLNGGNISLAQNAAAQIIKLDTNTWGAIESLGTPPGLVLTASQTVSGASTVSFNNCFSTTYDNYRISIRGTLSQDVSVTIRMRVGGADDTGANYNTKRVDYDSSVTGASQSSATYAFVMMGGINRAQAFVDVSLPALVEQTFFYSTSSARANTAFVNSTIAGYHALSTAYDGFSVYLTAGTFSGTIRVYGYRNS